MKRNSNTFIKNVDDGYMMNCTKCGSTRFIKTPIRIDDFLDFGTTWAKEHRSCTPNRRVVHDVVSVSERKQ